MSVPNKGVRYWEKKLWKVFSEYIRRKDADLDGMVDCYTCYSKKHWKQVDAGHFVSRNARAVKYDERNVKPQCKACNGFHGGMVWEFGQHLDRDYGEGTAEDLEAQRFSIAKRKPSELEEMYRKYRGKLDKA